MTTPASTFVTTTQSTTDRDSTSAQSTTTDSEDIYGGPTSTTPLPITTLTTPFVQATDCVEAWHYFSHHYDSYPYVWETTVDPPAASCRPSGWASRSLSPAVCPEGWTYYGISQYFGGYPTGSVVPTIATCCPSGYVPGDEYKDLNAGNTGECTSWTKPHKANAPLTATGDDNNTTLFSGKGNVVRAAWTIQWAPTEVDKLSPRPPSVTSYEHVIQTWVPGGKVKEVALQYPTDGVGAGLYQLFLGGVIGGPLAFVLICICCCVCCYRRRRRKARLRAQRESRELELRAAQRGVHTSDADPRYDREAVEGAETPAPRYSLEVAQDPAPPYQETPSKVSNLRVDPGAS